MGAAYTPPAFREEVTTAKLLERLGLETRLLREQRDWGFGRIDWDWPVFIPRARPYDWEIDE